MSQIEEPTTNITGYPIIAWAHGQTCILYQQFGSYQGEWLMMTKDEKEYFVYKAWYGSCSGCDAWGGWHPRGWEERDKGMPLSMAKEFAKDYKSFIEVPRATMRNLVTSGTLKKIMPANIRDSSSEIDYDGFCGDAQIAVKVAEDIDVTAADILACKNQEIKQTALKRFGYERFVAEAKMDEIHRDGENALLRNGDIVFAYVKDSSTPRRYLLRVPPNMKTVHDAIAWTFNMSPKEYQPLIET
jgi:hypothetical protein